MFALETPARVWQRVKALERQGHDLDDLPSLPAFDASTESESTTYESPRPSTKQQSVVASPHNGGRATAPGKENRGDSATPIGRNYSPATTTSTATERAGIRAVPSGRNFSGNNGRNISNKNATKGSSLGIGLPAPDLTLPGRIKPSDASSLHDISLESPSEGDSSSSSQGLREPARPYSQSASRRRTSPIPELTEPINTSSEESSIEQSHSDHSPSNNQHRVPSLSYSVASSLPSTADVLRSPAQQYDDDHMISVVGEDDDSKSVSDNSEETEGLRPPSRRLSPTKQQTGGITHFAASPQMPTPQQTRFAAAETPRSNAFQSPRSAEASPSAFATPRATTGNSDIERRKGHLLATLQLTAVRSQSRAKLKAGTPYPKRNLSANDSDDASSVGIASSGTDSTSNDLNPYPNANASLPLGNAPAARFNGAKLNNYLHNLNTHLTTENTQLVAELDQAKAEIAALRNGSSFSGSASHSHDEVELLLRQELEKEVQRLKTAVSEREQEVNSLRTHILQEQEAAAQNYGDNTHLQEQATSLKSLQEEIFSLRDQLADAQKEHADAISGWQHRVDELLNQLEEKDAEINEAREALDIQQEEFAEKMHQLEEETCAVVEELEQKAQAAETDGERLESEREAIEDDARRQIRNLENQMAEQAQELDQLRRKPMHASFSKERSDLAEAMVKIAAFEKDIAILRANLKERNVEIEGLQAEAKDQQRQHEQDILNLQDAARVRSLNGRQAAAAVTNEQIDALRNENAQLQQKLGETLDTNQQAETELRQDLEEARLEIERLELLHGTNVNHAAQGDLKDIEIATLARAKAELESRVSSLRKQINLMTDLNDVGTPSTPDKSLPFRSILGIPTPRTPGFYLSKSSNASSLGEGVSASVFDQMALLERQIKELRAQLDQVNKQLDDKLAKLQRIDREHGTTRKQLASAKARIIELESLLTKGGNTQLAIDRREIQNLQRELQRVKDDALQLGDDIALAKRQSTGTQNDDRLSYTKEETKSLLAIVQHLRARVTREANQRSSLVFQKQYLARAIRLGSEGQQTLTITAKTRRQQNRNNLQKCLHSVRAIVRMSIASKKWQEQNASKRALRDAYAVTRGKPYRQPS